MVSSDNRYVLSYNGEIYNYRELRAELETEGFWFRSQTDSEVVLNALVRWGYDAILRFNGMFAVAMGSQGNIISPRSIWHKTNITVNRWGILHSGQNKAITIQPRFRAEINKEALFEYFTLQNIFTDQTLLKGIYILPAGHFLTLKTKEERFPTLHRYWDYCFNECTNHVPQEEYIEELDRLFTQAVNRQLVGDVELGAYLSGGIDSGSITAIAAQSIQNLKTFTCGFDLSSASGIELAFDEREKAEAMSALFKTEHYQAVLKAGDMERSLPAVANISKNHVSARVIQTTTQQN